MSSSITIAAPPHAFGTPHDELRYLVEQIPKEDALALRHATKALELRARRDEIYSLYNLNPTQCNAAIEQLEYANSLFKTEQYDEAYEEAQKAQKTFDELGDKSGAWDAIQLQSKCIKRSPNLN